MRLYNYIAQYFDVFRITCLARTSKTPFLICQYRSALTFLKHSHAISHWLRHITSDFVVQTSASDILLHIFNKFTVEIPSVINTNQLRCKKNTKETEKSIMLRSASALFKPTINYRRVSSISVSQICPKVTTQFFLFV